MVTIVDNHQDVFSRKLCAEGAHFYTPRDLENRCSMTPLAQIFRLAHQYISFQELHLDYDV